MTFNSGLFDGIAVFVQVVESGGFSAAAERLGHSSSYVSKELTRLENRLGVRLLNRTTRRISLTDVGRTYFERCRQMVTDAEHAELAVSELHETPRGVLKISAPVSFGVSHLRQVLPLFVQRYPELNLEVEFNDRMVDVIAEGLDVLVRVGHLKDSNLIARTITQTRGVTVASPAYWDKYGRPQHPSEMSRHVCMSYSYKPSPSHWEYVGKDGKAIGVQVQSRILGNSAELESSMALAGQCVVHTPLFAVENEVEQGLLETVLDDFEAEPWDICAVYPHRMHLSAKVQVFIDFLLEQFGKPD